MELQYIEFDFERFQVFDMKVGRIYNGKLGQHTRRK